MLFFIQLGFENTRDKILKTRLKSLFYLAVCVHQESSSSSSPSEGPSKAIVPDAMPLDCMKTTELDDDDEVFNPLLAQDQLSSSDRLLRYYFC